MADDDRVMFDELRDDSPMVARLFAAGRVFGFLYPYAPSLPSLAQFQDPTFHLVFIMGSFPSLGGWGWVVGWGWGVARRDASRLGRACVDTARGCAQGRMRGRSMTVYWGRWRERCGASWVFLVPFLPSWTCCLRWPRTARRRFRTGMKDGKLVVTSMFAPCGPRSTSLRATH